MRLCYAVPGSSHNHSSITSPETWIGNLDPSFRWSSSYTDDLLLSCVRCCQRCDSSSRARRAQEVRCYFLKPVRSLDVNHSHVVRSTMFYRDIRSGGSARGPGGQEVSVGGFHGSTVEISSLMLCWSMPLASVMFP